MINRLPFLKSLMHASQPVDEQPDAPKRMFPTTFIWGDLDTGRMHYPTGSTFEAVRPGPFMHLIAAATLLEERLVDPKQIFSCSGKAAIAKQIFRCPQAHGGLDLVGAIAHGCETYFAKVSRRIDGALFASYCRRFGLDVPVCGELPGAFPEVFGDSSLPYILGISVKLKPSPMQILRLIGLIAKRGELPYLYVSEDSVGDGTCVMLNDKTWDLLQESVRQCGATGAARRLDPDNVVKATAVANTMPHGRDFVASVVGYFPTNKPRYVFCAYLPVFTHEETAIIMARSHLFCLFRGKAIVEQKD